MVVTLRTAARNACMPFWLQQDKSIKTPFSLSVIVSVLSDDLTSQGDVAMKEASLENEA